MSIDNYVDYILHCIMLPLLLLVAFFAIEYIKLNINTNLYLLLNANIIVISVFLIYDFLKILDNRTK